VCVLRRCVLASSGLCDEQIWVVYSVDVNGGSHEVVALGGDSPTPCAWDLCEQAVAVQETEQAGHSCRIAACGRLVAVGSVETETDVAIAEAVDRVLSAQHGTEQVEVCTGQGVEAAERATVVAYRLGESGELNACVTRIGDDREGGEVPGVGRVRDFSVAVEIGDAFGHGEPADDQVALLSAATPDFELVRMIDDCLDTQDHAMLVVHLDPVLFHPVSDPGAGPALPHVVDQLAGEVAVQLTSEESHDVLCAEAVKSVLQQVLIQRLQAGRVAEHDVGGVLGLVDDPVVLHAAQDVGEKGIDTFGELREDCGPALVYEHVGQFLGPNTVIDAKQCIVGAHEPDARGREPTSEVFVTVETDLDHEREPGGDPNVNHPEGFVDEVEVQTQTLASGRDDLGFAVTGQHFEAVACLNGRQDTDQAVVDTVALGDLAGEVIFPTVGVYAQPRSASFSRGLPGSVLEPVRMAIHKVFEIADEHVVIPQNPFHGAGPVQGQMPFEEDPVKTRYRPGEQIPVACDKVLHGASSPGFGLLGCDPKPESRRRVLSIRPTEH